MQKTMMGEREEGREGELNDKGKIWGKLKKRGKRGKVDKNAGIHEGSKGERERQRGK